MATEFDDILDQYGKAPKSEFADIVDQHAEQPPSPLGKEIIRQGIDVAKQIPSGLVAGIEAIPAFPARAAGFLGGLVEKIPGFAPSPEQAADRGKLLELTKSAREGVAQYLPVPETTAGQLARTASEFIPSGVAGARRLSIPSAAGVGATAGLTSEAAGQAAEGTPYEPIARLAGGLVGGAGAARQAEAAAARKAVPSLEEGFKAAGKLYDQFRASGVNYNPNIGPQFSQAIKNELTNRGLTDSKVVAQGTWEALANRLENTPARTPQDFHNLYQELGHIATGAKGNTGEALAARLAQERLLQFMENTPQGALTGNVNAPAQAVETLREANKIWAASKRAENVSQRITKAELKAGETFSGLNLENQLRQKIGPLADPTISARLGFSRPEQAAISRFAEGTAGPNTLRYVGNALAGGGGIGVPVVGGSLAALGGGVGYLTGNDPVSGAIIGATTPLAGLGMRLASNRWALQRAQALETMLRARSPLAAGRIPATQSALPLATLPPALAGGPLQVTVRPEDRGQ